MQGAQAHTNPTNLPRPTFLIFALFHLGRSAPWRLLLTLFCGCVPKQEDLGLVQGENACLRPPWSQSRTLLQIAFPLEQRRSLAIARALGAYLFLPTK